MRRSSKIGEGGPLGLGEEEQEEAAPRLDVVGGKPGSVLLGGRLTDVDVGSIRGFVREMTVKSLVPFMEKQVGQWNELVSTLSPLSLFVSFLSSLRLSLPLAVRLLAARNYWSTVWCGAEVLWVVETCESSARSERRVGGVQRLEGLVSRSIYLTVYDPCP